MINSFSEFLIQEENTVYFTLGRMNPPTRGHELLLNTLSEAAGSSPYKVYISKSQDAKKNPLPYTEKVKFARKMFPKHARNIIKDETIRTVMDIAVSLYEGGYKNVVMVTDGPRSREFEILLDKYNGVDARHGFYKFESMKFVSCGERNDLSEDIDGVSATKQRNHATDNNFAGFCQGLTEAISDKDSKALFNAVRRGMGLDEQKEFKNHVQLKPVSELREAYVRDGLFAEGDQVVMHKHEIVGNIKHLGSNYVIVESKGETWRCWLNDVSKVTDDSGIEYAQAPYTDPGDDGVIREGSMYKDKPDWGTPESTKKAKEMTPGEKNEGLWANIQAKKARGEKMRKKGAKGAPTPDQVKRAQEATAPQDSEIADRKGTQPAKYHKGLSKATKIARDRHFKAKKAGPAPGDSGAKTIPSKHTTFVRKMMDEDLTYMDRAKKRIDREKEADKAKHDRMQDRARTRDTNKKNMQTEASFADKSKASGISTGTLKKVYQRGVAAWKTGHRPGTNPSQWGHARVNAFIRKKKKGGLNHDKDLA